MSNINQQTKKNVLAEIVEYKRQVVAERKKKIPLESFKANIVPSSRSLKNALSNPHADFIFECKKASPSKGLIRPDFDLAKILKEYKDFASAVSILTDEKYFQGDMAFISQATKLIEQPILCKDFFIDEYQIYEARYHGADAVLLMLSVLDDENYQKLANLAKQLSLDVLTEVHDLAEMERAIALRAEIIGINNRDLRDLSIDLATTENLAELIRQKNPDAIVISESGIESHEDVRRLSPLVDGFLIGSSIMAQKDIRYHCKNLVFGNVKICGLTRPNDAVSVDLAGGNYGGLIFYPPSPRFVTLDVAQLIVESAPLRYVGVFVDESISVMVDTAKALRLFAVQLHGRENSELIQALRSALDSAGLNSVEIWKAIHVQNEIRFEKMPFVNRYLLDKFDPEQFGGTGKAFDWTLLDQRNQDFILAGGIQVHNLSDVLTKNPFAIDLSSGVESSPGCKSEQKIRQLFDAVRC